MSRRFSKSAKDAARIVQDADGEADHIKPWSAGGESTVENCQILDPTMNKTKGAHVFEPRKWQAAFLRRWDKRTESMSFMLIAIPGSGKTMASLEAARAWMGAGVDRRLIVVVPTDNLRHQWKDEASRFGIDLQTKEFGTNFKHGFKGGVATYHLVANSPLVFRKLCSVAPTMVIFDEIHHCGDEAHFGNGIKQAFELAAEKLLMSGTPWKTDGRPIPFVRYDGDGFAIGDYRYDYPDALNDEVVRYLVFDHSKGSITNDLTGEVETLDCTVSEDDAAFRLRRLLDADGRYVRRQVEASHRKLCECRKTIGDAGAMAVCIDQAHALKVAKIIQEVTGKEPSIVVSNSDLENDTVKGFRNSNREWLVSVRKVSEGTDIKRLQVLCYLTNTTSELFFRQVVGRVSRVRGMEDFEGYVYLPADPRLIRCATNIENAQVQAIREQAERETREIEQGESQPEFATYSTDHDGTDVVFIAGERLTSAEAREIERVAEATGVSMQKVVEIKAMLRGSPAASETPSSSAAIESEPESLEERMDGWRRRCNKAAFRLSKVLHCDVRDVHAKFKQQRTMTEDELKSKYRAIVNQIARRSR